MRSRRLVAAASALALSLVLLLFRAAAAADDFKTVGVDDLVALRKAGGVEVYDANPGSFREREGVIPGAHLLRSAYDMDAAAELPKDKSSKLVFYCANTH